MTRFFSNAAKHGRPRSLARFLMSGAMMAPLLSGSALACACGCGVFDVGAGAQMPTGDSFTFDLEYDYVDQDRNWSGGSRAPAADNDDKEVRTDFYTFGARYAFSRDWSVLVQVPYWDRVFRTTGDDDDAPVRTKARAAEMNEGGEVVTRYRYGSLGDIRVLATYSGFSDDLSTGLNFGVKLPTGDFSRTGFDRDTAIGTGTTDLLLGGFHRGAITADGAFTYVVNAQWQMPLASRDGYKPGQDFNVGASVYYDALDFDAGNIHVAPLVTLVESIHSRDSGVQSDRENTGYNRLLAGPGIEVDLPYASLYADVQFPLYQTMYGNQLTAPALFRLTVSHSF